MSTSDYNTKELEQIKRILKGTLNNDGSLEITYSDPDPDPDPGTNKKVSMSLYKVKDTDNYILAIGTGTQGPQESELPSTESTERRFINGKSLENYVSEHELYKLKRAVSDRLIIRDREEEFLYNIQDTKLKKLTEACYDVKKKLANEIENLPITLKQALNNESFPEYVTSNQSGLQLNPEKFLDTSIHLPPPATLNPEVSKPTTVLSLPVELAGRKKTLKRNPTPIV